MLYAVAVTGLLIASLCALGAAVSVAAGRGAQLREAAAPPAPASADHFDGTEFERRVIDGMVLDETRGAALTAFLFAAAPAEHTCWTAIVIDPALHGTSSHIRLVGHYATERAAVDAADQLADELNGCLVPGEAPLTATALGIEPQAARSNRPGNVART